MILQPEYGWAVRGIIALDPFETTTAVMQGVGHDMGCAIHPGLKLAVQPDSRGMGLGNNSFLPFRFRPVFALLERPGWF